MKTRIAINGFGRIGRNAFRVAFEREDIDIVAINDLTNTKTMAHLLRHDTVYGAYNKQIEFTEDDITVNGKNIKVFAQNEDALLYKAEFQKKLLAGSASTRSLHDKF